jgi:transcription antitermination factor NusG
VFEVSEAYKEGSRIRIKSGPLKDLEARIVKVNLKRNSVAIQLGDSSLLGKIWCSIEMIENINEDRF